MPALFVTILCTDDGTVAAELWKCLFLLFGLVKQRSGHDFTTWSHRTLQNNTLRCTKYKYKMYSENVPLSVSRSCQHLNVRPRLLVIMAKAAKWLQAILDYMKKAKLNTSTVWPLSSTLTANLKLDI